MTWIGWGVERAEARELRDIFQRSSEQLNVIAGRYWGTPCTDTHSEALARLAALLCDVVERLTENEEQP